MGSDAFGFEDGYGTSAKLRGPEQVTVSNDGSRLFVSDTQNHRIRQVRELLYVP